MKYLLIFIINLFSTHAFIDLKYKILYTNSKYSRLHNSRLKYTIPYTYTNIYRTTNIQLSLESEFEEIKKKFIENKYEKVNQENDLMLYETTQLSLMNNVIAGEWAKKWIYDMVNFFDGIFPQYIYKDMFIIREYCDNNYKNYDFYIGFFPTVRKCNEGPYYIAAFKLNPVSKIFSCKLIIQNPNYSHDDKSFLKEFKNNLKIMCKKAETTFDYSDLKSLENKRYYMVWKYDIDI